MLIMENSGLWLMVYRSDCGGIHFVFQNLNVGMTVEQFLILNRSAQGVAAKVDSQERFPTSASMHCKSRTIAIRADQFKEIALDLGETVSQIECLFELNESIVKTKEVVEGEQYVHQPILHVRLN